VEHHHPDRLGTRLVSNPGSGTSFEQATLPFGNGLPSESTGSTNRRFTSYERSNVTGLDYAVNRHYDSQQGRFTQVDPIGMRAASLEHPQTLNLYSYCGNDPVNRTDPDGLFFGFLKKLFRGIGRVISAVTNAVARVLNNRWVRIGVLIASFLVPFVGPGLAKAIQFGLKLYNRVADIVGELQLAGQLLQGKLKEFAISLGIGAISSALATLEDGIVLGLRKSLGTVKINGEKFINWKNFSFKKFFGGVGEGLHIGWRRLTNRSLLSFTPIYNFAGAGTPDDDLGLYETIDEPDELFKTHDQAYKDALTHTDIRKADKALFRGLLGKGFNGPVPKLHIIDVAFAGRPSAGSTFKFGATIVFGVKSRF